MRVLRIINNNIVSAEDQGGSEVLLMGRGLGFKAKETGEVNMDAVEKTFRMSTQTETDRLRELFATIPLEMIEVSDEIIAFAKQRLDTRLNQNLYLTLTDHVNFAVQRYRAGMPFHNALLDEVRRVYPAEFEVGLYALEIIRRRLEVSFREDEAASIALHIMNAEYETSVLESYNITRIIDLILQHLKWRSGREVPQGTLHAEQLIAYLKLLVRQALRRDVVPLGDPRFYHLIRTLYPAEAERAEEIAIMIRRESGYVIGGDAMADLAIHIYRVYNEE